MVTPEAKHRQEVIKRTTDSLDNGTGAMPDIVGISTKDLCTLLSLARFAARAIADIEARKGRG